MVVKFIDVIERKLKAERLAFASQDDYDTTYFLLEKHPRWTVITGYYCMHNIAKYFLMKEYGIDFDENDIHKCVVLELSKALKDDAKEVIKYLIEAKKEYDVILENPQYPANSLFESKKDRGKINYMSDPRSAQTDFISKISKDFLENRFEPFIAVMVPYTKIQLKLQTNTGENKK